MFEIQAFKIENDTLQPDIFLTEALLQRLGRSERGFTFWGSERESKIYELKFKLMHTPKYQIDTVSLHLSQLGSVLTQKMFYQNNYLI